MVVKNLMAASKKPAASKSASGNKGKTQSGAKSNNKKSAAKSASGKGGATGAAKKNPAQVARQREKRRFWSYILFFAGVLELLVTFIKGDGLWTSLYEINRGIFGVSVFLAGPMIIYVALQIASDKSHNTIVARIVQGLVLMLLLSGTAQIAVNGTVEGKTFLLKLKGLYNDGVRLNGGGIASAAIGWPLLAAFKRVGGGIIIGLLDFTFIMLLTDLTLPDLFRALSKPFVGGYKAVSEERIERAMQPPKEKPDKTQKKKSDRKVRIDIAKYYQDDVGQEEGAFSEVQDAEASDVGEPYDVSLPSDPDGIFGEDTLSEESRDKKSDEQELKRIIEKAVAKEQKKIGEKIESEKHSQPKQVFVDGEGQTSLLEQQETVPAYVYPPVDILKYPDNSASPELAQREIEEKSQKLVETLETFGVKTRIIGIHRGPSVTRYELQPAAGVKVKQITNLADDIALNLAANGVRIEAPIPGKAAIGIEIPNIHRDSVSMRELIDSKEYRSAKSKLSFAVGKDIEGNIVIGDIASMPHMLIAGTTGSGKSVFTNSIILNILFHASPDEVKLILIDPKKVEFPMYNGIPHLLIPVVTEPLKAAGALGWAVNEMMRRYKLFEANGTKNLEDYNQFVDENPELERQKLARIVIVVDEFADLMLAAKSEVEESVMRLAQLARAAGMHMLIATQSPRVDVLTGLIKANIPSRTALSVSNNTDSRVILDEIGAEKLLGKGDMLYKPVGMPKPLRIQSGFASTAEIRNVVKFLKNEHTAEYSEEVIHEVEQNIPQPKGKGSEADIALNTDDDLTSQAISIIVETGNASTAFLQRKLKLGFPRAARIMDEIEEMGIIGPQEGSKPRKINITKEEWLERQAMK
ncbi:DNA translocase FtsK [Ruminococcus sp. Marseille-P6503]|uniref:DNA translocase FtsK n=1 Tax=Ruminococcus sp. Marseille-P6503 TaxID=2364796 RepID=UPI001FA9EF8A|nr:DNA translocase FtsK [Ruminococcus sp. Marseille-P6503]